MLSKLKLLEFWAKIPFKNLVYFSFSLNLFLIAAILLLRNFLPPEIPLFYGKPVGETQLTSFLGFLIAPLSSLVITSTNILISFWTKDLFARKILIVSSFFVSALVAITVVKVVFLVGFF